MLAFDTLQIAKDLEVSFTPEQSELLATVLGRSLTEGLVTKQDLSETETRLRGEIKVLQAETAKWISAALAFNLLGAAGLVLMLARLIGH